MRLTNVLLKHNYFRMKKATWQAQRKRSVLDTRVKDTLVERNIEVFDANSVAAIPRPSMENLEIIGQGPLQPLPGTPEHPDYHEERVLTYKDHNVLLEGLEQAKLLTNTIEPSSEKVLPSQLTNLIGAVSHPNQDKLVKRCINASLVYEAEQVKLPIRKDPERPAWIFARDYGISDKRKNELLCKRLLRLCELISHLSGSHVFEERFVLDDAYFAVPLTWNDRKILLNLRSDLLLVSKSMLSPFSEPETYKNYELPDLHPMLPIVSLENTNSYQFKDKFPIDNSPNGMQIHTAFVHYNETEVQNLYGEKVEESQILGRTLMKAYAFALAQARQNYGAESEGQLSAPVIVQTIQTNSQWFHFSVLQLNTFDLLDTPLRNYFWSTPLINLYSFCGYNEGRPELKGYNPEVFKTLLAFYNNVL